jgi:Xaa-Pro aminopeptidase
MVHSVEPGIYFIPELIESWRAERHLAEFVAFDKLGPYMAVGGIRNEEDWLITSKGARRLGPPFDKSISAMEALRA